jgi:hypothetical protein
MLRRIGLYIIIVFALGLMYISTSRTAMQYISERRNENPAWWGVHKPVEGDLVTMAYLEGLNKYNAPIDYKFTRPADSIGNIDFYTHGDSYIWKIPDTAFAHTHSYRFGWRYRSDIVYTLDTARRNILLIEVSERYARMYFSGTNIFNHVKKAEPPAAGILPKPKVHYASVADAEHTWIDDFFNPNINQNLEYNLFNYNVINPIRRAKAELNYYLFGRASGDVVIADNGQHLFIKETQAGKRIENNNYPLQHGELNRIIYNLNKIYDHYKQDGFDEVYLSIIPNPATIVQPQGYNRLIPLVEQHPALKMKVLSVYELYQKQGSKIYRPGDTHWNNDGLQFWLKEVNDMLRKEDSSATG